MKHILDWYNENTPQNEDEYEKRMLDKCCNNSNNLHSINSSNNKYLI